MEYWGIKVGVKKRFGRLSTSSKNFARHGFLQISLRGRLRHEEAFAGQKDIYFIILWNFNNVNVSFRN